MSGLVVSGAAGGGGDSAASTNEVRMFAGTTPEEWQPIFGSSWGSFLPFSYAVGASIPNPGSFTSSRYSHGAALIAGGSILVAAGISASPENNCQIYSPDLNLWQSAANLPGLGRSEFAMAGTDDGKALVIGGRISGARNSEVWAYSPESNQWTARSPMPSAKFQHFAVKLSDGSIFVAGGQDDLDYKRCYLYDPSADSWTQKASLPADANATAARSIGMAAMTGNRAAAMVGADLFIYNLAANQWSKISSPAPLSKNTSPAVVHFSGGRIGYFMGNSSVASDQVRTVFYDFETNNWTEGPPVFRAIASAAYVALPDDRIIFLGGVGMNNMVLIYVPSGIENIKTPYYGRRV